MLLEFATNIFCLLLLKIGFVMKSFDTPTTRSAHHGLEIESIYRNVLQKRDCRVLQVLLPFIWSCAYSCCIIVGGESTK